MKLSKSPKTKAATRNKPTNEKKKRFIIIKDMKRHQEQPKSETSNSARGENDFHTRDTGRRKHLI